MSNPNPKITLFVPKWQVVNLSDLPAKVKLKVKIHRVCVVPLYHYSNLDPVWRRNHRSCLLRSQRWSNTGCAAGERKRKMVNKAEILERIILIAQMQRNTDRKQEQHATNLLRPAIICAHSGGERTESKRKTDGCWTVGDLYDTLFGCWLCMISQSNSDPLGDDVMWNRHLYFYCNLYFCFL